MNFSARRFITIAVISTYCLTIFFLGVLTAIKIVELSVFLAAFTGLGGLAGTLVEKYFERKDRTNGTTK